MGADREDEALPGEPSAFCFPLSLDGSASLALVSAAGMGSDFLALGLGVPLVVALLLD